MPTTTQMLTSYPDVMLQVIGELRGAFLDGAESREQATELLAAQITDPTSVQMAYQETTDMSDQARAAVETLLKEGGELVEAQFSREFGSVRQMGPAKLERETPWFFPENIAETLYYYGLLGRGFKGTGQNARAIVYLPSDIVPWLPQPQGEAAEGALPVTPVPPPLAARTLLADDSLLEDAGTLLGFIRSEGMGLAEDGPDPDDVDQLVKRFQLPFAKDEPLLNARLALLLHLANRLGWLTLDKERRIALTGNAVRAFLEQTRAEQRQTLFTAWRDSPEWNDLCRVTALECTETGSWHNDPQGTREAVLRLIATLQPGMWYSQDDVIRAIRETAADFQRPTGNYDTWYIRSRETGDFLKGFEQWEAVEGALLRFLFSGPLHWLHALDLAEPSAGDDFQIALSDWGARWLGLEVAQPEESPRRALTIDDSFRITMPHGTSLAVRFRIERFASWEASYPQYVYQINQRSLQRAQAGGISRPQILKFLERHCRSVPEKVSAALAREPTPEPA